MLLRDEIQPRPVFVPTFILDVLVLVPCWTSPIRPGTVTPSGLIFSLHFLDRRLLAEPLPRLPVDISSATLSSVGVEGKTSSVGFPQSSAEASCPSSTFMFSDEFTASALLNHLVSFSCLWFHVLHRRNFLLGRNIARLSLLFLQAGAVHRALGFRVSSIFTVMFLGILFR